MEEGQTARVILERYLPTLLGFQGGATGRGSTVTYSREGGFFSAWLLPLPEGSLLGYLTMQCSGCSGYFSNNIEFFGLHYGIKKLTVYENWEKQLFFDVSALARFIQEFIPFIPFRKDVFQSMNFNTSDSYSTFAEKFMGHI
ncbi:4104_t:CDS:2 [Funneliformis geosporum]|nr:4104_t:CDS:2 [Funneliformis geosporum]